MYIRITSRKNKDGKTVEYVQLAHNEWDSEKKRSSVQVLHNFGRKENVDTEGLLRLANSIQKGLGNGVAAAAKASDCDVLSSKAMGGAWYLDGLWRRLDLDTCMKEMLKARNFEIPVERSLFAMVANRALDPASKLSVEHWVGSEARIEGLPEVGVHQLYRTMDFMLEHEEELQKTVFSSVVTLLNLEVDLIYFDTTSTYFEIEEADEDGLRQYGHSKDHRDDLPQVVIGMAVTKEGIPVRCWIFEGNTADMSIVERVKKDLNGWKLGRVISVCDRGFNSEENCIKLQSGGGHYIIGEKMRSGKQEVEKALSKRGRYTQIKEGLVAKEAIVGEGERRKRFVIVMNEAEAKKDKKTRERHIAHIQTQLDKLYKEGKPHSKALYALISHPVYGRYIRQTSTGKPVLDKAKIASEERLDGKYIIRTSDDSLGLVDIVLGYKQLLDIERGFRTLKTDIALRPVYHRKCERIRAHILICWLALLLIRVAENEQKQTWHHTRRELQTIHAVELQFPEGTVIQSSKLSKLHKEIFNSSSIKTPPKLLEMGV